jgi:hypothetical protein
MLPCRSDSRQLKHREQPPSNRRKPPRNREQPPSNRQQRLLILI